MSMVDTYLESARFEFRRYKTLGDKTFEQLDDDQLLYRRNEGDNSIAQIVKHMAGNMLSRWTDFLHSDGEKPWRHRDTEFEHPPQNKPEVIALWEKGWDCLFSALSKLDESNFDTTVYIRNEPHSILAAINRQIAHYANHVGQIVILGKHLKGDAWQALSVPKGGSKAFNQRLFGSKGS